MVTVASLRPPAALVEESMTVDRQPRRSAYRKYMRSTSWAKSPASSPPAPARTSRMTSRSSFGSLGRRRILSFPSRSATRPFSCGSSSLAICRMSASASSRSASCCLSSSRTRLKSRKVSTSGSSCERSFISVLIRAGSARTRGSPRSAVRRSNLCSISCSLSSTRAPDPSRPCGGTQCAGAETVLQRRAAPGGSALPLDTKVVFAKPPAHDCDLLAVLVPQGALGDEKISDAHFGDLDRALSGLLKRVAGEEEFSGKEGQSLSLHTHEK